MAERKNADQVRDEIATERAELDAALAALSSGTRQSARTAGIAAAALAGVFALVRFRPRRRSR